MGSFYSFFTDFYKDGFCGLFRDASRYGFSGIDIFFGNFLEGIFGHFLGACFFVCDVFRTVVSDLFCCAGDSFYDFCYECFRCFFRGLSGWTLIWGLTRGVSFFSRCSLEGGRSLSGRATTTCRSCTTQTASGHGRFGDGSATGARGRTVSNGYSCRRGLCGSTSMSGGGRLSGTSNGSGRGGCVGCTF